MKKSMITLLILVVMSVSNQYGDNCVEFPPAENINPRQMFAAVSNHFEKNAQSFMFTRPVYRNLAAQQTAWHDFVYEPCDPWGSSAQAIAMYQHTSHLNNVARYFMINKQNIIIVKGDAAQDPQLRNIRAEWINLPSNFVGTMQLNPQQRQASLWLEFHQKLFPTLFKSDFFDGFWIALALPIQYIENNPKLRQNIIQTGPDTPGLPTTIFQAFNQNSWEFGKISLKSHKKMGLSEIVFKLGTVCMNRDGFQIGAYTIFTAPTAAPQQAEFLFNPFLGNNRHFVFGTGVNFQFPLNSCQDPYLLALFFNIENLYLVRNIQWRTLDLKCKAWSRYLLLNALDGRKNIPAVNILTRKVRVKPFNMADISVGFRYENDFVEFEAGYDLWLHGDEMLKLHRHFPPVFGIAGDGTLVPGTNVGATASASTIAQQAPNDMVNSQPAFIPIVEFDLDLLSGSTRAAVVHRWHVATNLFLSVSCCETFIGLGAFFETPQQNTAFRTWGAWAKIGISL